MEYDFGALTTFKITYLESRDATVYEGYLYPNIVDGAGRGMLDDMKFVNKTIIIIKQYKC